MRNYIPLCNTQEYISYTPEPTPKKPVLFKLHGTYTIYPTLVASWDEVQHLPAEKRKSLRYYLEDFYFIFVGYSARDPDIRDVLREERTYNAKIFWVSPNWLEESVQEVLEWYQSLNNHIRITSDDFFKNLEDLLIEKEREVVEVKEKRRVLIDPLLEEQYRPISKDIVYVPLRGNPRPIKCEIIKSIPHPVERSYAGYHKVTVYIRILCPECDDGTLVTKTFVVGRNDKFSSFEFLECDGHRHWFILRPKSIELMRPTFPPKVPKRFRKP